MNLCDVYKHEKLEMCAGDNVRKYKMWKESVYFMLWPHETTKNIKNNWIRQCTGSTA